MTDGGCCGDILDVRDGIGRLILRLTEADGGGFHEGVLDALAEAHGKVEEALATAREI